MTTAKVLPVAGQCWLDKEFRRLEVTGVRGEYISTTREDGYELWNTCQFFVQEHTPMHPSVPLVAPSPGHPKTWLRFVDGNAVNMDCVLFVQDDNDNPNAIDLWMASGPRQRITLTHEDDTAKVRKFLQEKAQ